MKILHIIVLLPLMFLLSACGSVSFNMSGASVVPAKTCQINYFENRAEIVISTLSSQMTEGLKDKIQSNTKLALVTNNADVLFEGEITGYATQPQAVTAEGKASMDRLTITVKVKFTNEVKPEYSFEKSFSRFYEYSSSMTLASVQDQAITKILEELMDDIFNAAFSNW